MKFALTAAAVLLAAPAFAVTTVTVDFETIEAYPGGTGVLIDDYYAGGKASNGAVGPDLGISFAGEAMVLCLNTPGEFCSNASRGVAGVSDKFGMTPLETSLVMNVAGGFTGGFSFLYASPYYTNYVQLYDGVNGTGDVIGSILLPVTPLGVCRPGFSYGADYCPFIPSSINFDGIAKSVVFYGVAGYAVYDDLAFGAVGPNPPPVPEPAAWMLLIAGFGMVGASLRRRAVGLNRVPA